MDEIQTFYTYLRSQQAARDFLFMSYNREELPDAEVKSYENCHAFLYYLDHGLRLYENGKNVDSFIRPILYFYGMVHLLKASLLAKRPNYPESTSLLAHGVTTRKKKKKNYTFIEDEVKVQINGLFPYFTEHLYSKDLLHFEKVKMGHLLALIPEISPLFSFYEQEEPMVVVGSCRSDILLFPITILDHYQVTDSTFLRRIKPFLPEIMHYETDHALLKIKLKQHAGSKPGPFFVHGKSDDIYFPQKREYYFPIAEVMIHYLLLYNLSMLCRYETEWWGDLFAGKTDQDYSFIIQFLSITAEKIPELLGKELLQRIYGK